MGKEVDSNKEFEQGFACACATLLRMHNEDSMVMDTLRTCFKSFNHLATCGADPFDLNPLLRLWKRETGTQRSARLPFGPSPTLIEQTNMETKQNISQEQDRADGNRAVPRRSFSDYGQWLDVFWEAVKLMGGNPHMSQAFTEVAWRDGQQPEDAAAEYCGLY